LERAYYDVLDVRRDADEGAIKKAYKKAALLAHPDKGGSDQLFQMVNEAFKVLTDSGLRAEYDRDIKKFGLKDGQGLKTAKEFQRQSSIHKEKGPLPTQQSERSEPNLKNHNTKAKQDVKIPDNFEKLGVKDLKNLLDQLDIGRDDCFEKDDLINKVKEHQNGAKKSSSQSQSFPKPPRDSSKSTAGGSGKPFSESFKFDSKTCEFPEPVNLSLKIISVGNQEVGKSCLIKRYCEGRFVKRYISTIGIDYGVKKLEVLGQKVNINFFDLSGNDEYKMIRTDFYKNANGIIMAFDVDNRDSYISLVHWEEEMKRYGVDVTRSKVIVCGTKVDQKSREVKEAEAARWAKQRGWEYFETSSADGKNITECLESLF